MFSKIRGLCPAILSLLIFPVCLHAAPDTLLDSRSALLHGVQLNDDGKYKEAIAVFRTVPEGDTNYAVALNELTLTSLNDSAFAEARDYAMQGLALPNSPQRRSFMLMLGHAEDYLGHHDAALRWYDSLLAMNPYDHQPWYEKGALYLLQKDYDKAIACYRHAILLNPAHFRSHLGLGSALLKLGRPAEAYLPLCFSMFMTGDRALAGASMSLIDGIQVQHDDVVQYYKGRDEAAMDPAFAEADEIIRAKLALSSDYKFESVLAGDASAKTLHALLEKVKYDPSDSGIVMQYYLPFFSQAMADGQFDDVLLLMFSGYGIEDVDRLAKKHQSGIQDFRNSLQAYTDKIAATQVLHYQQRQKAPERYALLSGDNIFVVGGIRSIEPLKFAPGQITFYKDGCYTGTGLANASGEREGEWINYHSNGVVSSRQPYRNGKPNGTATTYRENGTLEKELVYDVKGDLTEERDYTYNGILESATKDHGDYADYISYLPDGTMESKARMAKGKIQDPVLRIMREGNTLAAEIQLSKGERDGVTKLYHSNGKLSEETEYSDGKRQGKSVSYYENGQTHFIMNYKNDELDGPYQEFNEQGKLIERGEYHKGRKTGQEESFTPEGRLYGVITYKKDLLVAYQYTDDSGHVLSAGNKNSEEGLKQIRAYYPNGVLMSEVPLSEGNANGVATYYYRSGALSGKTSYKDARREGKDITYFANGLLKSEVLCKDGHNYGTCTAYADNGAKSAEGFLDGDNRCGPWTDFYPNGKPSTKCFYINGKQNGPEQNFFANGRPSYTRVFDMDMITGLTQYDTNGTVVNSQRFPAGNGQYKLFYPNGKLSYESGLKHGNLEGRMNGYFPDGSLLQTSNFVRGRQDGELLIYHPNGAVAVRGNLRMGRREGTWTWYDPSGIPEHETEYANGDQEGMEKVYMAGILHTSYQYHKGEMQGREILYGDSNKIAGILIFDHDLITGYTYHGKDGKELPVIPLKNGTGHILTYYPNGQPAVDYSCKYGSFTGDGFRWYSNGTKAYESHRDKNNNYEGAYRRWAPDGRLVYETFWQNGIMTGTERCWNAKGELLYSTEYCDTGDRHGTHMTIDPASGKKGAVRYYYGSIVAAL